jgi:hypothetical protein
MGKTLALIAGGLLAAVALVLAVTAKTDTKKLQQEIVTLQTTTQTTKAFDEYAAIDHSAYQAVFLDTTQTYFGNIKSTDDQYIELTDIFYLSSDGTTLVKLGCEQHEPDDKMFILKSGVRFWENLKDEGQVSQAIDTWKKENPNGQKCPV